MEKRSEATINSCLQPEEKLLWSGKPDHQAGASSRKRNFWIGPVLQFVVIITAVWIIRGQLPQNTFDRFLGGNEPGTGAVIGISVAIFVVFFLPGVLRS